MTLPSVLPVRRLAPSLALAMALAAFAAAPAAAQNHDLEIAPAPNVTGMTAADRLSPDVKVGADFGDASVPDVVRRGVANPVYARFYVNGVDEFTDASGSAQIRFHWRNALAGEVPPALADPSWSEMPGSPMAVTWAAGELLLLTTSWPADFTPPGATFVTWTPPAVGDLFHVRVEVVHPDIDGENPDMDGDNVAVSLYESQAGLADVDLVIAHDLSGSMLSFMYAGDTYLAHAISRAQAFVASMNESHRLAVVGFGGCLAGDVTDVWTDPAVLQPANLLNKLAALGAIGGLSIPNAGCLTPMGVGLDRSIQVLAPVAGDRKKTILLLTDGYENSGAPRACTHADPADPCLGNPVTTDLMSEDVRVFSIALGAAAWTDCLVCLTDESDGQWYAPAGPGIDLAQVYLDMQQVIAGDDLYRADRGTTGGGDDEYETFFEGLDDLLYFILQTDRLDTQVELDLRPPGGGWQNAAAVPGSHVERDRGWVVARVEKPAAGDWGYRVVGEPRQDYLVAVRSDRVGVRLAIDVESKGRVGSPIRILARLTERGEPLRAERLTASVQVPAGASLDSRLQRAVRQQLLRGRVHPLLAKEPRRGDLSPRAAFIDRLTDNRPHLFAASKLVDVELEPRDDGTWVGWFKEPVDVAGVYTVTVAHRGEKADREVSQSVQLVADELDFRRSFAELLELERPNASGQRWLVRFYPTDRSGNAIVDPKLLRQLKVTVRGARSATKPSYADDSAVEVWFDVRQRRPSLDSVTLAGEEIRIQGGPR